MIVRQNEVAEQLDTDTISAWDILVGLIPAIACLPLMIGQAITLWRTPETRVGLVVWLFLGIVVAWRARGKVTRHSGRIWSAVVLCLSATACLFWGTLYWSYSWTQLAFALFLVAWGLGRANQRRWYEIVEWGILLIVTIPNPLIFKTLDTWLTLVAAKSASLTLDAFGITHYLDSLQISIRTMQFSATSATSVKLGLYAVMCCTVIWCWFRSRSLAHTLLLLLGAAVSLVATRYLAILGVSYGSLHAQGDWITAGSEHYIVSALAFLVVIVLIILTDQSIAALLAPVPTTSTDFITFVALANTAMMWPKKSEFIDDSIEDLDHVEEFQKYKQRLELKRLSWYSIDWHRNNSIMYPLYGMSVVIVLILFVALAAVIRGGLVSPATSPLAVSADALDKSILGSTLSAELGAFRQADFVLNLTAGASDSKVGTAIARWSYRWQDYLVFVQLIAPVSGWQVPREQVSQRLTNTIHLRKGKNDWQYYDCKQTNPLGGDSYLLQCGLSDSLIPLSESSQAENQGLPLLSKLSPSLNDLKLAYDIRVACESGVELTSELHSELREFFEQVRSTFKSRLPVGLLEQSLVVVR